MPLNVEGILYDLGVEVIRESGDELIAKCPQHLQRTGREDAHPSWSMNTETYVHHCFSCGYSGTLNSLYRDLLGEVPEDLEWELSKQSVIASVSRVREPEHKAPEVNEWVLSQYVGVPGPLLERRRIRRESADFFGVRWDRTNGVWVIPIRDIDGGLMGFQYRQKGIVLNNPTGMEKSKTLFGMHLFKDENTITVVESPLDAVRFWNIGVPAVATFGAGVSEEQVRLLSRYFTVVIIAMDDDAAGQRAGVYLRKELKRRGTAVFFFDYSGLEVKDPGDVNSDEDLQKAWQAATILLPTP